MKNNPKIAAKNYGLEQTKSAESEVSPHGKMNEAERIIHAQFVRYGRNAREWTRKCALLLPRIARERIWEKKKFGSIYEYAAKLAGMSRSSVDEALRVLRKIEDKPELLKIVEAHGLQRVRPIAAIATAETAAFWAAKAEDMSKNTLETYVREYRKEFPDANEAAILTKAGSFLPREEIREQKRLADAEIDIPNTRTDADLATVLQKTQRENQTAIFSGSASGITAAQKQRIEMELDPEVAQKLLKLKGGGDWNELMKKFLAAREEKLEKEKPAPAATGKRNIPAAIENYVTQKTAGQCAYPGCEEPYEILHHTQRYALEKIHDPDRLAPLCKAHERIAHLGLIENEEQVPENWKLRKTHDLTHHKRQVDEMVWLYR